MKRRLFSLMSVLLLITQIHSQACIDTVVPGLTLLSKSGAGGSDCLFSVKFCVKKTTTDADHVLYAVYHSNGEMNKTVDVSGLDIGSVVCETFTFVADCNSTASFLAVGLDINNSICGFVVDLILLPIRLISFTAEPKSPGSVMLQWETASESNSSYFIVQESRDARSFNDIAKVKAAGESRTTQTYSLLTKTNSGTGNTATTYYRLKMIDQDASYTYSSIIKLGKKTGSGFSVYPNPASSILKINLSDLQKEAVSLWNLQGQKIELHWLDQSSLDIHQIQPGLYMLKYQDEVIRWHKN